MKRWFAKFRISSAQDEGKPLSAGMRQKVDASEELRQFVRDSAVVERALKAASPEVETPPALHSSIMRAVRATERSEIVKPAWSAALLLRAGVAILLVLACGWWLLRPPAERATLVAGEPEQVLTPAATALEMGQTMAQTVPAAAVAPLSEEWLRISKDVNKTAEFLQASLP